MSDTQDDVYEITEEPNDPNPCNTDYGCGDPYCKKCGCCSERDFL